MHGLDHDEHSANGFSSSRTKKRIAFILLAGFTAGLGIFFVLRLQAATFAYVYPPDKNILVSRSSEPDAFSAVSDGGGITVTIAITNNEGVALRGFYYSDQVPNGWVVNTAGVTVNGSPIADYTYGQGYADEVYTGFTPHRWALEMPQGDGVFSPTHPISASSGTAQIVYTMIVSGGTGSDYAIGYEAWAGWLETVPTGTAVFGYQTITSTLNADFSADPRSGVAPLTVHFTDTSTGGATAWAWDFGDASPISSQQHPTHTYDIPGIYTVTLEITGTGGSDQAIKPNYITTTVSPPTANFSALPLSGTAPLTVTFTDLSAGNITAWTWNFGDGLTSMIQYPTHTYTILGQFGVTLTVSGPGGSDTASKPDYIVVGPAFAPPVADFSASPLSGTAPLTVTFTDLSAGDVTTWTWNFGDGTTAQVQSPTHVYNQVGRFTVSLTVSNAADSAIVVKPDFITVTAPPLQADFTAQPRFWLPPLTVQFTDLSVGEVLTRVWDFGDVGTITSSLLAPTHTYNALGYYTVSLSIQDAYTSSILVRPRYIHVTDEIYNAYLPVILKDYVPQH